MPLSVRHAWRQAGRVMVYCAVLGILFGSTLLLQLLTRSSQGFRYVGF